MLVLCLAAFGRTGAAADPTPAEMTGERVLGKADAPATIVEYASLTCPHCAAFQVERMATIKKEYIETGKAKLIYRDFPLDKLALVAAMVARCAPTDRYFGLIDILYRSQGSWGRSKDPVSELAKVARLAGMSETSFNACLKNRALYNSILERRKEAEEKDKVDGTPTILIDGKKIDGTAPMEKFREMLDAAAGK